MEQANILTAFDALGAQIDHLKVQLFSANYYKEEAVTKCKKLEDENRRLRDRLRNFSLEDDLEGK